jgi:hypothetical protein
MYKYCGRVIMQKQSSQICDLYEYVERSLNTSRKVSACDGVWKGWGRMDE